MDEQNTNKVPDSFELDPDEMILPDDFDPSNETYDLFAEPVKTDTPTEAAPTTEQAPVENDALAPEQQAVEQAPTTAPVQPDAQTEGSVPQADPATPPEATVPPVPQTIKVKFNHEERELNPDEAAIYAQKGMNYDRVQQKLAEFEARSKRSEDVAKRLGYKDTEEMLAAAEQNLIDKEVEKLVERGNTEDMARFIVEQRMQRQATAQASAPAPGPQTQPAAEQTPTAMPGTPVNPTMTPEREAELREFVQAHPGVTKLPDEVIRMNRSGVRLLVAYERFQNQAALKELAILKQNQAAAAKAPVRGVSGKPAAAKVQEDDPFLKGFDSDTW